MVKHREPDTLKRKNLFLACIAFGLVYAIDLVFHQESLGLGHTMDIISIFMLSVLIGIAFFFAIILVVPIIYYVGYRVLGKKGMPPKLNLIAWVCYWLVVVYSLLSKIIVLA